MTEPTLPKAPHGAPCNNCGRCCHAYVCPLGAHVFYAVPTTMPQLTVEGPCPALEPGSSGALVCGLVAHPERYAPIPTAVAGRERMSTAALFIIGAGVGCDAHVVDELEDKDYRRRVRRYAEKHKRQTRESAKLWGLL